ncbi:ciliary microtubule-associated protein 3 isoform X3 [Misgurnus anguillicaudatus]|uniref:ciliary microtubule-associated protein 3 isoform X3 n=1 Tax=Misgurnus anguillicaudatus TaxID=75329 RepID=UPI003CCF585F
MTWLSGLHLKDQTTIKIYVKKNERESDLVPFCEENTSKQLEKMCSCSNSMWSAHSHLVTMATGKQHQKAMATQSSAPRVAFGSCQKRLMFPTHFARDRMGNELLALRGSTELGPGCYDNHNVGTLVYDLQHKPESKRGYALAARTAPRFLPSVKMATPSPQKYQEDWAQPTVCSPGKASFNSSTQSPGAYAHDTIQSRKVCWPMKFGSPDWSRVPLLERKALRTELLCDRDFRTQRNRIAYLRLYY